MEKIKDNRIQCPYCKIKTWDTDYRYFMRDHDRPDGRRCQKARLAATLPELKGKEEPC